MGGGSLLADGGGVGFGEGIGLEYLGFIGGELALEYAEQVVFQLLAVGEAYCVVERRTADAHDLAVGVFLIHAAADGFGHERFGHALLLAVDVGPAAFVAELDAGAVGEPDVVVGAPEQMAVDLNHAYLGFGEVLVEHLAGSLREILAVDAVFVDGYDGRCRKGSEQNGGHHCQSPEKVHVCHSIII